MRKMKVKTAFRFHLTPGRMPKISKMAGKILKKEETLFSEGGNEYWHSHSGNQYGEFSKD